MVPLQFEDNGYINSYTTCMYTVIQQMFVNIKPLPSKSKGRLPSQDVNQMLPVTKFKRQFWFFLSKIK